MPFVARTLKKLRGVRYERFVLAVWAPVMLVGGAYLLAGHALAFTKPKDAGVMFADARGGDDRSAMLAVHVLFSECGCSRNVVKEILARGPRGDMRERVVLVGDDAALVEKLEARGFRVETMTAEALASRYHVEAAPLLVVVDAKGSPRYVGGYTDRKRTEVEEKQILDALARGEDVPPRPVFGCAVSKSLQKASDPFGLR